MARAPEGRLVVITGASQGIGRASAMAWAREGADIVAAARNLPKLEALASKVHSLGRRCEAVACDVAEEAQVRRLKEIAEATGQVDILFNYVGHPGNYVADEGQQRESADHPLAPLDPGRPRHLRWDRPGGFDESRGQRHAALTTAYFFHHPVPPRRRMASSRNEVSTHSLKARLPWTRGGVALSPIWRVCS